MSSPGGSRSSPVSGCQWEEVLKIIESRLPTQQPALVVPADDDRDHPETEEPDGSDSDSHAGDGTDTTARDHPPSVPVHRRLYRQTRRKLTHYWLGIDNPPGWLETAVIVTARLFAKEGLSEDEGVQAVEAVRQGDPRGGSSLLKSVNQGGLGIDRPGHRQGGQERLRW